MSTQTLEQRIQDLEILITVLTRELAKLIQDAEEHEPFAQAWLSEPEYELKLAMGE